MSENGDQAELPQVMVGYDSENEVCHVAIKGFKQLEFVKAVLLMAVDHVERQIRHASITQMQQAAVEQQQRAILGAQQAAALRGKIIR